MQATTLMNGVEGSSCCVIEVREKHSFLLAGSSDLGLGYVVKKAILFFKILFKIKHIAHVHSAHSCPSLRQRENTDR